MKNKHVKLNGLSILSVVILAVIFLWNCSGADSVKTKTDDSTPRVIGYIAGWYGKIDPGKIRVDMLTHINYAFSIIKDGKMVIRHEIDPENFKILGSLRNKKQNLKILVSVGGWADSGKFSDMALTAESRKVFIDSAVEFIKEHKLDGLDVDWEYPAQAGNNNPFRPEDTQNFTFLLKELRERFDREGQADGKHYLLTIAAAADPLYRALTEVPKFHGDLDFINLMTYDFTGPWTPFAGHHTNLYSSTKRPGGISTKKVVNGYLDEGVPREKLVVGVAFYGHAWKDVEPADNGLFQKGTAMKGNFSFGSLVDKYIDKNGFRRYWDDAAKAPYLWNVDTRQWISYDDEQSINATCDYVKKNKLGGIMFWEWHEDSDNRLLKAIDRGLR